MRECGGSWRGEIPVAEKGPPRAKAMQFIAVKNNQLLNNMDCCNGSNLTILFRFILLIYFSIRPVMHLRNLICDGWVLIRNLL